jgi:hypothetical protein
MAYGTRGSSAVSRRDRAGPCAGIWPVQEHSPGFPQLARLAGFEPATRCLEDQDNVYGIVPDVGFICLLTRCRSGPAGTVATSRGYRLGAVWPRGTASAERVAPRCQHRLQGQHEIRFGQACLGCRYSFRCYING